MEHINFELNINASHASFVFENTQLHRNITITRLFLLNYTKIVVYSKVKQHFACFHGSKIVYDLTFCSVVPFQFSSKLDHTMWRQVDGATCK